MWKATGMSYFVTANLKKKLVALAKPWRFLSNGIFNKRISSVSILRLPVSVECGSLWHLVELCTKESGYSCIQDCLIVQYIYKEEYCRPLRKMYHVVSLRFIDCNLDLFFALNAFLDVLYFRHDSSALGKVVLQNYRLMLWFARNMHPLATSLKVCWCVPRLQSKSRLLKVARMFLSNTYKMSPSTRSMYFLNAWIKDICNHFNVWS